LRLFAACHYAGTGGSLDISATTDDHRAQEARMTPQERQLIDQLFERLASLENNPRDSGAVQAINEGLERAPNALYPMVQTVLVQDEALKRADARIRELEAELGINQEQPQQQGGFLDNMRDALLGRREQQGSVPNVRPGGSNASGGSASGGSAWGNSVSGGAPMQQPGQWGGQPGGPQPGGSQWAGAPQQGMPGSGGGSFLGTAAAGVAGVVGGALLMNSMRGMFGGSQGGQGHSAFDQGGGAPWGGAGSTGGGDLARDAGINDIGGGSGKLGAYDSPASAEPAGLFDVAGNDPGGDGGDFDVGGDFGGSSDV
jgi:hypothetical protein